ncbi:4Fe-4S dicluster domain-containing protein (plasmid) [Pedobacter sp. BS3]|uniref:TAT-variant-translocated molybdopterin oxidoreductase n=1 Tax=Pedobacter sp. BS3 TaxID=2567937 RepID=UPI0011ED396A|nr:TAT-variant-translocated molybdopterin oxidoreductase [Pedobacter sp. BS3]TZF85537.1 4Fe-4S dicluster domain-containing protein [Pedobacter sp. BS3]
MESNKKYWKGLEELHQTPEFVESNKNEFAEELPIEKVLSEGGLNTVTPRRDFLKALGFGLGAVSLAACQRTPVHKSIPYLVKPEEVIPGIPNYYVSSYKGQSILVKTREGRPIKIEGNPSGLLGNGGTDAQAQASVLDLYDVSKLQDPQLNGSKATWDKVDSFVKGELSKVQAGGKKIRIISSTVNSPSTKAVIADFTAQYPNTKHINIDAVSYTGIIKANENSFGKAVLPRYRFDKADVIVSFGADFLGTWITPEEYTKQYVSNRNAKSLANKKMSRHIQFETGMSLTGTNADSRVPVKPSEQGLALIALYNAVTGTVLPGTQPLANTVADKVVKLAAKELVNAKGRALVVSGSNDVSIQILVNAINAALGSYGATIDLDNPSYQYAGNDAEFAEFINEMSRGEVGAVFFLDTNPAYDYFDSKAFTEALKKVDLRVSFADREDETASLCNVIAINHNYLESWGDENAFEGYYTVVQPAINPVYNSRQAEESLLTWADAPVKDYYQYVRNNWERTVLAQTGQTWRGLLQKGFIYTGEKPAGAYSFNLSLAAVVSTIVSQSKELAKDIELHVYEGSAIRDGRYANNAYLQELPDPVSKVTWDNYAAIAPKYAEKLGLSQFDLIEIKDSKGYSVVLPVLIQPGQAQGTVSIALGYGRTKAGKAGNGVGQNAYPFTSLVNGTKRYTSTVTFNKTGDTHELAQTQTHHSIEGRNVIRETTFKEYLKNPAAGSGKRTDTKEFDLWYDYEKPGQNWVMAIDLNACTGCGACIVACNVENNIPVVGRDEVRRRREMHWIRIDRYYSFEEDGKSVTEEGEIARMENLDNVKVVHQPMLCQHCDHAPCETVCPVLATVHSSDGLNYMAYNRCVGTRYCANNCPYKVRRFNWFNYWNDSRFDNYLNNEFTQLLLNPDVTPRSRGVMEKCSMCIQRIQAGKLQAKMDKRVLKDGDIKMACQQACTAGAIIFGDLNDPESEVAKALKSERTYYVLEEIGTQPGIGYQVKVRNTVEA